MNIYIYIYIGCEKNRENKNKENNPDGPFKKNTKNPAGEQEYHL